MTDRTADEYATELLGGDHELFVTMAAEARAEGIPLIQVPAELGRLLSVLVAASNAHTALEIGTLFGQSGTIIARALPPDGSLTTLEVSPKHAAVSRRNFERANVGQKVEVIEGDAKQSLRSLNGRNFDFVFIDADKTGYPAYLDLVMDLVHDGSVIVADNVWRGGQILDQPSEEGNAAILEYNRKIASNSSLISTLVPTRSGGDGAIVSVVRRHNGAGM